MKYMLDTNIIIYAKNNSPEIVRHNFEKYSKSDLCISSISLCELEFGVFNSSNPELNQILLAVFLSGIEILPFDANASIEYGKIRSDLKKSGTPIGSNDLLIAAHAKSLDLTLITNNTKEFNNVHGLKIDNWM